jgi:hypothetical protein
MGGEDGRSGAMTEQQSGRGRPGKRRLSDKILVAFYHACDQPDVEVAWDC